MKPIVGDIPYEVLQRGGFIGPRFTGVFFFQNIFWRVPIPLVFGTQSINAMDALRMMPDDTKRLLCSRIDVLRDYLLLWADCLDYDTGFREAAAFITAGSFTHEMIKSTEREITSALSDLSQERPNSKAMHSSRDATEKALKAYLAHHVGLTSDRAKAGFSHRLDKLLQEVERHAPQSPLLELKTNLDAYAAYEARYSSTDYPRIELWRAYRLTQFAAAEVYRSITPRNQRATVKAHPIFAAGE